MLLVGLASVQCWAMRPRWSTVFRDQAALAVAWLGTGLLALVCWPLALVLALVLWRTRDVTDPAVLTWGVAGGLWAVTLTVPSEARGWVVAAYVASALGQCGVLAGQGVRLWRVRAQLGATGVLNEVRDGLHGSMGTRFFCGMLCAQAIPLAPAWAWPPLLLAIAVTGSLTALLMVGIGLVVLTPALLPGMLVAAPIGLAWMLGMRKGWRNVAHWRAYGDTVRARTALWRLTIERWGRLSWRDRLIGQGQHAFSVQARWWASIHAVPKVHSRANNDAIQALLEIGLVGTLAVMWLAVSTLWGHGRWGDPLTATVAALLVGSLLQFPLHAAHTAVPAVILTALLAAA